MKVHEFETIVNKLHMETRDSKHRIAYFVHNGTRIVKTMRSHGKGKFIPEHLIRKQLHLDQDQFTGLYSCSIGEPEYIEILTKKGVIVEEKKQTDAPADKDKKAEQLSA